MIPAFPQFRQLSLDIARDYREYLTSYPPYADFNLTNRLSWDLNNTAAVSLLHGNLVLRLPNYVEQRTRLTVLGSHQLERTIETLLAYAQSEWGIPQLELVPEHVIRQLPALSPWRAEEDIDSHDHVLSMMRLVTMDGPELRHYRRAVRAYARSYESTTSFHKLDVTCHYTQEAILRIFLKREVAKHGNNPEYELLALRRLLAVAERLPVSAYGVSVQGILRAFIIYEYEPMNDAWAIGHFWKADTDYTGIYSYLMHRVAGRLSRQGVQFLNTQQDLGIPGLRNFKLSLAPVMHLRKYTLRPSTTLLSAAPVPETPHR